MSSRPAILRRNQREDHPASLSFPLCLTARSLHGPSLLSIYVPLVAIYCTIHPRPIPLRLSVTLPRRSTNRSLYRTSRYVYILHPHYSSESPSIFVCRLYTSLSAPTRPSEIQTPSKHCFVLFRPSTGLVFSFLSRPLFLSLAMTISSLCSTLVVIVALISTKQSAHRVPDFVPRKSPIDLSLPSLSPSLAFLLSHQIPLITIAIPCLACFLSSYRSPRYS